MNIGILDYGAGNIRSVENALSRLGVTYFVSSDTAKLDEADKIIFPGVGHAKSAMAQLRETRLDIFLKECKKPVLGICLGMQLLFEFSEEDDTECLGIIPGKVIKFEAEKVGKVPHMGWNDICMGEKEHYFYFVHSYYVPVSGYTISTCDYGEQEFSAIIQKDNFIGMQFHPEKSGEDGTLLLKQFCEDGI